MSEDAEPSRHVPQAGSILYDGRMELEFIRWLQETLPSDRRLSLGIGDDAAIVDFSRNSNLVITSDLLCDGVHFVLNETPLEQVGYKAAAVSLSDLAAMAASPIAISVSLLLPRETKIAATQRIMEGMFALAREFDFSIAGGDTNTWNDGLAIDVTAIGTKARSSSFLRSAARPGDAILVTGELGGSILGKHLSFQPRVNQALQLDRQYSIHAAMDISDGLLLDLSRILEQSNTGARLDLTQIPISAAARRLESTRNGKTALGHALSDGEDFELLFTVPAGDAREILKRQPIDIPITRIGEIIEGSGMVGIDSDGNENKLAPSGYEHGTS